MPDLKLAAGYADAARDELLAALEALLEEQEGWSVRIAALHIEISIQRIAGWNSGYRWGWLDCTRDLKRKGQ